MAEPGTLLSVANELAAGAGDDRGRADVGAVEARWAVETARRVIAEFHRTTARELPDWL